MKSEPENTKTIHASVSNRWKNILKFGLALVLVGIIFSKTNLHQIKTVIQSISFTWLGVVFFLFCLQTAMKGVQYWVLFGRETGYFQVLKIVGFQNAMANLVSNTAGFASYLAMFRVENNITLKRSGTIFVITKTGDLFSIAFFALLSASLVWDRIEALHGLVALLLTGTIVGLIILWSAVIFRESFVSWLKNLIHGLQLNRFSVVQKGLEYLQALAAYDRQRIRKTLLLATTLSLLYLTTGMFYYYSRVQMVHVPIDLWPIIFMVSINQFVSLIPLQIFGGLGTREITSLYLYQLFGVTQFDIPAALIGLRILSYLFHFAILGALTLTSFISRRRDHNNSIK